MTVGALEQKNLSNLVVADDQFCITSKESGEAHLFSAKTKKLVCSLQMNGQCNDVAFSGDNYLFTAGDQAEVWQWDLRMRRCLGKLADEGAFSTTKVDVSPDGKWLATGSKMGTVNIFSLSDSAGGLLEEKKPLFASDQTPEKTVMSLTTAVTSLKFGPTSEVLAYSSKWKKNALRMVHLPSFTAY
jgi:U3 small nucleolar RNA-associated protein 18